MDEGIIDLKRQLRELKAHEKLSGFAGFHIDFGEDEPPKEGVLKIADFIRPDGSGYLTLTFQTDADPHPERQAALAGLFDRFSRAVAALDARSGQGRFGLGFQYVMVTREGFVARDAWFVVDMDLYYGRLVGRVRSVIEEAILPGLATLLPITFEPVSWWEAEGAASPAGGETLP